MSELNYHNTNNLRGDGLKQADKRATKQTDWIKAFFQRNPTHNMTPSAVLRAYNKAYQLTPPNGILLTSVRRAISDLAKNNGVLEKLDLTTRSPRGGREGYWCLRLRVGEQGGLGL